MVLDPQMDCGEAEPRAADMYLNIDIRFATSGGAVAWERNIFRVYAPPRIPHQDELISLLDHVMVVVRVTTVLNSLPSAPSQMPCYDLILHALPSLESSELGAASEKESLVEKCVELGGILRREAGVGRVWNLCWHNITVDSFASD